MAVLEFDKEGVPMDKKDLLKQMQSLDEGIVSEYIDGLLEHVQTLITWRDIFSSMRSESRCLTLIEKLDNEKLERLVQITNTISKKDLLQRIQQLLNQSFCWDPPHCSSEKAVLFIETLQKIDVKRREEIAITYGAGARDLRNFSEIILAVNRGLLGEEFFVKLNDSEMDTMLKLLKELVPME